MKTNIKKEKLMNLVSSEKVNTAKRNKDRIRNRKMLRESRAIALKILNRLDDLGWTKKKLADKMGVLPQQVTKFVSGKENLTLETQVKLQEVLDIPILATYYENKIEKIFASVKLESTKKYTVPIFPIHPENKAFFQKKIATTLTMVQESQEKYETYLKQA